MDFLAALYYLTVWSCGLVNLFVLALLFGRDRDPVYRHEFLLMLSFMLLVVFQSLSWAVPLEERGAAYALGAGMLVNLGLALQVYALPAYVTLISQMGPRWMAERWFIAHGAATGVAGLAGWWLDELPGWSAAASAAGWLSFGLSMAAFAYCIGQAVVAVVLNLLGRGAPHQENNETVRVAVRMGFFSLALMPLVIMFDFLDLPVPGTGWRLPPGIHVTPLILLAWSVLLLRLRVSSLMTQAGGAVAPGDPLPAFAERYGISPRELEVVALLVGGLSYEGIADRLCISLATVKTHVNRLYRKAGVNSKVELIHCLAQAPAAAGEANQPKG